jgi:cytochrome c oxidase subunit 3
VWEGGVAPYNISSKKLGMWLFIISDALTFSALLIAYAYVRVASDNWPLHFEFFPSIVVATVMTFALLTSSITMVMAVSAAKAGNTSSAFKWIWATIAGGVIFLVLHANEWNSLIQAGLRPFGNPWGSPLFGGTFFVCTGLHMLHVTIGVVLLAIVAAGNKKGKYPADYVEIAGLYWHFVDLVWMFIFPLIYLMSIPIPGAAH